MSVDNQNKITPLVSIVVPCYNVEQYIDKGLQSILSQTYSRWECILVNDGSTDTTEEKIKAWTLKDQRFKLVSQSNKGLSGARNAGLKHIKGDCIYFFDPDDLLDHNCLTYLTHLYEDSIDVVIGKVGCVYNQTTEVIRTLEHIAATDKVFTNTNFIELYLKESFSVIACNKLYNASFILSHNLSFKDGIVHEDELWFFKAMYLAKQIIFSPNITYYYNIGNQNSITKNYSLKNLTSYIDVIETIYETYYLQEKDDEKQLIIGTYILNLQIDVTSGFFRFLRKNKTAPFKQEGIQLITKHLERTRITRYQHINDKKSKQYALFIDYASKNPEIAFRLVRNTNKKTILKFFENVYLKFKAK